VRKRTILVVEDDAAIRRGMVDSLTFAGYDVVSAADGHEGLRLATRGGYDLLLLDLILPGPGGMKILAEVRVARPTIPVIILTAKGDETDRVKGLMLGADDYVVKPFSVKELLARMEAVLRRSPERPQDVSTLLFAGGIVNMERSEVCFNNGRRVELSERERDILRYLAEHRGRAVSRDELLRRVWRLDPAAVETRTIDMHVARLREKLDDDPANPAVVLTVRGKGYMFAVGGRVS
jgi:DNA-binding response OmpR family regulator